MSTGLGDLSIQVSVGVENLGRRDELRAQIRKLAAVDKATDLLLAQLRSFNDVLSASREAGFAPTMADTSDATAGLTKLVVQLNAGDVDREFAQSVIDGLGALLRTAADSLALAWRTHVISRVPTQEGLLVLAETFRAVQGASNYAQELQAATTSVGALLSQPLSAEAVRKLDELATTIPVLLQQLVGEEPEVREFADQLAHGGANIDTLTPAVTSWMQEKGFAASFKVVPGRPAGGESK